MKSRSILLAVSQTSFFLRETRAQKNNDLLPEAEWWLEIQEPCDSSKTSNCVTTIANLKGCVDACRSDGKNTTGHINYKFPRHSACIPNVKSIPRAGFVFDIPAESIDPAFAITGARLAVNTYRIQEVPLWESCEANLFLRAHEKGRVDNEISGISTSTVCASRRWYLPNLSNSARSNTEASYFDLLIAKGRNASIPNGIGVHSAISPACVGFSPNTLFLQATY